MVLICGGYVAIVLAALHSKDIAKFLWFNKIDSFSRKIKHVDIRDKVP